jgi:hypothetical protein
LRQRCRNGHRSSGEVVTTNRIARSRANRRHCDWSYA